MKTGRTLTEIAEELDRQAKTKKDYLADTRFLAMSKEGDLLSLNKNGDLKISNLCHGQIAARLGIPQKYYDRMRTESPNLLSTNVNHWFEQKPERRLVRSLDGRARAFLSERYRPLDNFDLAEVVLPKIKDMDCKIESAELTETRLYLKAVTNRIQAEIKPGDIVQAGLVISNSEVGCGSVKVEPLVYILRCANGMIAADHSLRKYHVGRGHGDLEYNAMEFFKDETRMADDKAFWMKVRDVVEATLDKVRFDDIVDRLREAADKKIEGNPIKAVELISNRFVFTEDEQGSVLRHLIEGKDLSAYGLSNAVTQASQDVEDYDRATDLERMGGAIIELPKQDWAAIASAN